MVNPPDGANEGGARADDGHAVCRVKQNKKYKKMFFFAICCVPCAVCCHGLPCRCSSLRRPRVTLPQPSWRVTLFPVVPLCVGLELLFSNHPGESLFFRPQSGIVPWYKRPTFVCNSENVNDYVTAHLDAVYDSYCTGLFLANFATFFYS